MKSPIKALIAGGLLALTGVSANAATYTITNAINTVANGFGSSGFHDQVNGQMSGSYFSQFVESSVTGAYNDTVAGDNIYFSGALQDGGMVDATGRLEQSASRTNGLFGDLMITVAGSATAALNGVWTFSFADATHGVEPNGIYNGAIALWGDNGNWAAGNGFASGLDLRLALTDGGTFNQPPAVPLPAAGWLLIAGLGGLGVMRKFRK